MKDLFGEEKIRTLGLYQPYASLMLNGKVETRWVANDRKPPFPFGWYLIYSCKKAYKDFEFKHISGEFYQDAKTVLTNEPTVTLNGHAIAVGYLIKKMKAFPLMMPETYVGLKNIAEQINPFEDANNLIIDGHTLWALTFQNVKRIKPFPFKGKQGVGILTEEQKKLIQYADNL
jgi:hypothetical protein